MLTCKNNIGRKVTVREDLYVILGEGKYRHSLNDEGYIVAKLSTRVKNPYKTDIVCNLWKSIEEITITLKSDIVTISKEELEKLNKKFVFSSNKVEWGFKKAFIFIDVKGDIIRLLEQKYK